MAISPSPRADGIISALQDTHHNIKPCSSSTLASGRADDGRDIGWQKAEEAEEEEEEEGARASFDWVGGGFPCACLSR